MKIVIALAGSPKLEKLYLRERLCDDYVGSDDKVLNCDASSSFVGVVHYLERGDGDSDRKCIVALAQCMKKKLIHGKQIKSKKKKESLYETCI